MIHNKIRKSAGASGRTRRGLSAIRARLSGMAVAWAAIIMSVMAIPMMLAYAGSMIFDGVEKSIGVADCVIVADFRNPTSVSLASPFSKDGNNIYIRYTAPAKDNGTWSESANFTLTYNNGILDKDGQYHPLYIRFNNPKGAWSKGKSTSVTKTSSEGYVKQVLVQLTADTIDLRSGASERYVGTTNVDKAGVTASSVGVVAWTNVSGLKYNLYARDIDQPNRLTGDYTGNWSERIAFVSTQLQAAKVHGEGSWTHGGKSYNGSQFVQYDSTNSIVKSKASHDSSVTGNINGAAFAVQAPFNNSYSASNGIAFRWTGSQCETKLFQDLAWIITTKAGPGGKCEQVPGTNANGTAIALIQRTISEGGFTTSTSLKAVHKNNYVVRAVPNPGYHVVKMTDNGANASGSSVSIGTITGNHTVTATFAPNNYKVKFDGNGTALHPATGTTGKSESGGYYATVDGATGATGTTSLAYGTSYVLNANGFARSGYTFVNWNQAANGSGTARADKSSYSNLTTTDGGTVTLYAQWDPYYHVKFDANGGTGTTANVAEGGDAGLRWDKAYTLTENGFTREGYRFLGWSTDRNATSPTYADKASIKATSASGANNFLEKTDANAGKTVTLYAVWLDESHGAIEIRKQPADGGFATSGNPEYSMAGAVYGIYSDQDRQTLVARVTTNDAGVATAQGLDAGPYFVKEITAPSGYGLDDALHIVIINGTETVDMTSTEPVLTGALSVTKNAIGDVPAPKDPRPESPTAEDGWFRASVTLTYPNDPYAGKDTVTYRGRMEYPYRAMTEYTTFDISREGGSVTGHADIWLGAGITVSIPGIPLGTTWSIEEYAESSTGYQVVYSGQSGTVSKTEAPATATITNIKGSRQETTVTNTRKSGSLTVSKEVVGEGIPADTQFQMEVSLDDPYGNPVTNEEFEDSDGGTVSFDENGVTRFSLASGQSKTIVGIPTGCVYSVSEAMSEDEAWHYVTKYNGGDKDAASGELTSDGATVAVTNAMRTGSLTVEKDVADVAGANRGADNKFRIAVILSDESGTPYDGTIDGKQFAGANGYEFELAHGQSMKIEGIPVGFHYRVEERLTGNNALMYVPSYEAQEGVIGETGTDGADAPDVPGDGGEDGSEGTATGDGTEGPAGGDATTDGGGDDGDTGGDVANDGAGTDGGDTGGEADGDDDGSETSEASWENPEHHAIVHNTYQSGTIQVTKTVTGTGADPSRSFGFKLTMSKGGTPLTGEFGGLTFDANGTATFSLTAQTGNGANTKTIGNLPLGYDYAIEETGDALTDYTPHMEGATGTLTADSPQATVTCQNEIKTGSLTIQKTLAGSGTSATESFSFEVTLTKADGTTPQAGTFGGITFGTNGKNSTPIQLTGAEGHNSITISGIPYGTKYSVTEQPNDKYTPSWTGGTGTVGSTSQAPVATCLNTRKTADLTIKKVVDATIATSQKFRFTVTLRNEVDQLVSGAFGEGANTVSFMNGSTSFELGDNETKTIPHLPVGYKFAVDEATTDNWETTWASSPSSSTPKAGEISANTTVTATNKLLSGGLTVKKVVANNSGNEDDAFQFTVTVKSGDTPVSGQIGNHTFDENGQCTFSLKHNESESLTGIPSGCSYEVSEQANDRYGTAWSDNRTGTISSSSPVTVTATNTRKTGKLTISKVLSGTGAETEKDFSFNVTLKNGDKAGTGTFGGCSFTEGGYGFTLKGGASKVIEGIPTGWTYTVSETPDEKYATAWSPNPATGTITDDASGSSVTATNTRKTGGLTVKKVVTGVGSDPSQSFSFEVDIKLDGQGIATGTYGDVTLTNGHGSFTLTGQPGGDTKVITSIPTGSTYAVSEATSDRYIASWQNQTGTVGDQGATATCTNDLIRGDLKFTKIDEESKEPIPGVVFVISSDTTGERHVSVTGEGGVLSTAVPTHSTRTNASDAGTGQDMSKVTNEDAISASNGIWFQGKAGEAATPDDGKGALPVGTYTITELRCVANRGYKMADPFKVTITATGTKDIGNVGNTPPDDPGIPLEHGDTTTIYKDATPAPNTQVNPGEKITYTLTVRNTGADVCPRMLVRDYIPEGTTYDAAQNGGVFVEHGPDGGNAHGRGYVEWVIDDIAPREERQVSFSVSVEEEVGWFVLNTAYAKKVDKTIEAGNPSNPEPTDESNTTIHPTTPRKTPSFVKVTKTSDPVPGTQVAYMSEIQYSLTAENTGGTTARNVGVYDPVPVGTECSDLPSANSATLSADGRSIGWIIPSLEPGASVVLRFTVKVTDRNLVKASGIVRNQASWGDMGETTTPPTTPRDNTTNIVEHPLYEAPPETAETYKWSDPEPETKVGAGASITYELTTTNTGAATKPYVLVRDYIPEGTTYDEGNPASDGGVYVPATRSANGRAYVEWLLTRVIPNSEVKRTFTVKVTESWRAYVRNRALSQTISEPLTPGDPSNPEPSESSNEVKHPTADGTEEDKFPIVKAKKSASPKPGTMVAVGRRITYAIDLSNDSKATAYGVRVFDRIPEGTAYVEGSAKASVDADAKATSDGIGWAIARIAPKATVRLTFDVTVTSDKVQTIALDGSPVIRNQAHWSYENVAGGEGATTAPESPDGMENHTNVVEHPFVPGRDIQTGSQVSAYKDSEPKPNSVVKAGDEITYRLTLRHTGTTPQSATIVRDSIPKGATYKDGSASDDGVIVADKGYVEWVVGEMNPGDEKSLSFAVTVNDDAPTYIRNMALYGQADEGTQPGDPSNPDPELHTNEVWHTTDPEEPTPPVVQVIKSAEPPANTKVNVGDTIRYTLHVTNTGGSTATNQGVHDAIQDGLALVDKSVTTEHHGTVTNDGRGVAWVIESLEAGASVDLGFSVTATASVPGDVVRNQATWGGRKSADDIPSEPMENTSNIVEHPLEKKVNPVLRKDAITKGAVGYGATVEFQITVKNEGDIPMEGYVLEDAPQAGLAYLSDDKGGTKGEDGKVRWNGLNLGVGDTFTAKVKCRVTARTPGKVTNKAILYEPDGNKIVAIGDADIIVEGIANDLVQMGAKGMALAGIATISVASVIATVAIRRRRNIG